MGITDKKMETTMMGCIGFRSLWVYGSRVYGFACEGLKLSVPHKCSTYCRRTPLLQGPYMIRLISIVHSNQNWVLLMPTHQPTK